MLTENELAWLVQRNPRGKVGDMFFSCHNCEEAGKNPRRTKYKTCRYRCKIHKTHKYELQDALVFSERVATKLATIIPALTKDKPWPNIFWTSVTPDMALKWARLRVEEEMDNDI